MLTDRYGYQYLSPAEIERVLTRFDRRWTVLLPTVTISFTALVMDVLLYLPPALGRDHSELILPITVFALSLPVFILSIVLMRRVKRRTQPLVNAMFAKDMGIYVDGRGRRKKFGIKKGYLPFEMIKSVYLNGDIGASTVMARSGVATTITSFHLPDMDEFEERWGDRIEFIRDRCYLWFDKGKKEGEFTIVNRILFSPQGALLYVVGGTEEVPFPEVQDMYAIPWSSKPNGLIVTFYSKPNRGFMTFEGGDLFDWKMKWKEYWKRHR